MNRTDWRDAALVRAVQRALSDDLRRPPWRGARNPLAGHCYVASEALWHLLGGMASAYTPKVLRHNGATHWFLERWDGRRLDPTAAQFRGKVPYRRARGCGFLTTQPSRRAQTVISRVKRSLR